MLAVDDAGIRLDRTVFYPHGGGQAGDSGALLAGRRRASCAIADTRKGATRRRDRACAGRRARSAARALQPGTPVTRAHRLASAATRHMRFHTATHLLCALVPHPVDGCSITADYARLDFHMTEPLDKEALNAGLARLVAEAHAVRAPLDQRGRARRQPAAGAQHERAAAARTGRVRVLEIDGVDLQPCGGTHVANTAEIGARGGHEDREEVGDDAPGGARLRRVSS